ncbi:MAG: glucose 1-dehydrogenase [Chloroflexi bacterium]|nr:glucose 1-dehydrogenase [Chloroflexota bacterium]
MAGTFDGKIALVTGGATGIGLGAAQAFARAGATVVIAARRADRGEQAVLSIRNEGGKALFIQTDVAQEEQVEALVGQIMERFGRLDCAFNNAGQLIMKPLTDYTLTEWNELIATNLTGIWLGMKYQIPAMLEHGRGSIVNMASVSAVAGMSHISAYAATKGGVVSMTIAAAIEYARQGIRVNTISTGAVRTEMTDPFMSPEREAQTAAVYPIGRIGTPQDIGDAVLFLCSDASSFITGQNLMVDGGFTMQ